MPEPTPEPEPDDSPYSIPLPELTGRHGYALMRGEDDGPPDPGAPVAYVADPMKERPSGLTIEGMIRGVGDAAQAAAREGGRAKWVMRAIAAGFIIPAILTSIAWVREWF